jgi:TolA-binding protein
MKKQSILLLLVVVAGVVIISFAQGTLGEKPAASHEIAEMQIQINELQGKVQVLEGRLKGLESTVQELKTPHLQPLTLPGGNSSWFNSSAALPKPPTSDSTPPKIWGEREINGWTFYIVPCGEQGHGQDESQAIISPTR